MPKIYFHVDVNSAFLSWSALKALQGGSTVDLRTIPAVVGGDEAKRHGVVLAKSTPAKKFGIQTGESLFAARVKCPGLTVVPPDFDFYLKSFNRFLIISLDVLICRYSPLFRAFPALFISEEPHKSFYYPSCFRSQK